MIADYDGDISNLLNTEITGEIPVLTTRNLIVFPGVVTPILVGRESSVQLVKYLDKHPDAVCAIVCQRDSNVDTPAYRNIKFIPFSKRSAKCAISPLDRPTSCAIAFQHLMFRVTSPMIRLAAVPSSI